MLTPTSNKPKITTDDVQRGTVNRYFLKNISTRKVTEVDEMQYKNFNRSPYYQSLTIPWTIGGNAYDITTGNGQVIRGAISKNTAVVNLYESKMQGINRILYNPLEYFSGTQ